MLHPLKQHVFLEYLVENTAFYSTKRALRVYTACNKWLKEALGEGGLFVDYPFIYGLSLEKG